MVGVCCEGGDIEVGARFVAVDCDLYGSNAGGVLGDWAREVDEVAVVGMFATGQFEVAELGCHGCFYSSSAACRLVVLLSRRAA